MSRMLKALKQLDAKSPRPQRLLQGAPQPNLDTGCPKPSSDDSTVEAALARVEIAAAAIDEQLHRDGSDRQPGPWPLQVAARHAPAYAELAENIVAQLPPGRPAALLFTSPNDAEGKTETLVSLSAALAQRIPRGVVLVDGNFHKPDLASCLGLTAKGGLGHVLTGQATWQQVVQHTPVAHLDLLPGVQLPAPRQSNLGPLLDELRGRYGLVLIDAASLARGGVAAMASYCDGTYLVVRLHHTARRDLASAAQVIQDYHGQVLGSVVVGC